MKKKNYSKPLLISEAFVPQEYVAACGDSGKVYKFTCDAREGTLYYYPSGDGNIDGVYNGYGKKKKLGSYHPCKVMHEAEATSGFYDGFVDYNRNERYDSGEGVIVWRGEDGDNGHATANLNMDSWETAKS